MPKRRPEGPRPYAEAFPGLDVLVVERMAKADRLLCEWVDEDGRVAGHVRIREFSETRFVFDQQFSGPTLLPEKGQRMLEIVRTHRVAEHIRPTILHQGCGKLVQRTHLVLGGWRCRNCHSLWYHSQRASKTTRDMLLNGYLVQRSGSDDRGLQRRSVLSRLSFELQARPLRRRGASPVCCEGGGRRGLARPGGVSSQRCGQLVLCTAHHRGRRQRLTAHDQAFGRLHSADRSWRRTERPL
ncbi:hypothetical protein SAMN05192580_1519 [Sphingomonas jatrophae]|uniref:Uncharacterized protein n=1 Tax=Sphingomonas jatrophae TaxID=1166337 RepID=A0A1I6KBF4_9SPHN|nr:hypothetical protein SAMN05192580_1519 [Sphingomonas jatrophae]